MWACRASWCHMVSHPDPTLHSASPHVTPRPGTHWQTVGPRACGKYIFRGKEGDIPCTRSFPRPRALVRCGERGRYSTILGVVGEGRKGEGGEPCSLAARRDAGRGPAPRGGRGKMEDEALASRSRNMDGHQSPNRLRAGERPDEFPVAVAAVDRQGTRPGMAEKGERGAGAGLVSTCTLCLVGPNASSSSHFWYIVFTLHAHPRAGGVLSYNPRAKARKMND